MTVMAQMAWRRKADPLSRWKMEDGNKWRRLIISIHCDTERDGARDKVGDVWYASLFKPMRSYRHSYMDKFKIR